MSWDNSQANGRFGPFSNSNSGSLQSGLTNQSTSPLTPPAPTPNSGTLDFSGYNPATNSTGYGAADPSTLNFSGYNPATMGNTESGNGISAGSGPNAAMNAGWGNGAGDNSTITMADGGVIPAQGGTVAPDLSTALASVQSALSAGRQAFGLPSDLLGDGSGQQNQSDSTQDSGKKDDGSNWQPDQDFVDAAKETPEQQMDKAYIPAVTGIGSGMATALRNNSLPPVPGPAMAEGGNVPSVPGAANPDEGLLLVSQAQREAAAKAKLAAKEGQGSDVLHPGGNSYADGGVIPADGGDMDAPAAQGMPAQPQDNVPQPQQGQTQPANDPMAALKAYAMGAGAMPPDQAMALEQQVDPTGSMDPSQRKLLAVASAQDPKTQFSLLQHYRQRFQALSAFARAAAEGTQARPANIAASTDAATRAFHNVPNGHSISFTPAGPGKVAVTMANYAGGDKSKQKSYDDGGPVTPDPEDTPTDADGAQSMSNVLPEPDGGSQGDQPAADTDQGVLPTENSLVSGARLAGKIVHGVEGAEEGAKGKVKQTVMSVSDYLNGLKNSMYDAYMGEVEPDQVLAKAVAGGVAASGTPSDEDNAAQGGASDAAPAWPSMIGSDENALQPQQAPAGGPPPAASGSAGTDISVLPEHPTHEQIDAFNASNGGNRGGADSGTGIPPALEAQAAALFPRVGQMDQRNAYIASALAQQRPIEGQLAVARERTKGMQALWGQKEGAINSRATARDATSIQRAQIVAGQRAIASGNRDLSSVMRAIMTGVPGTPPKDAFNQAKTLLGPTLPQPPPQPPQQPPQQPAQQSSVPPGVTEWLKANPQLAGTPPKYFNGQWYARGPNGAAVPIPGQ